jgi:transcriptional regulator with XRE-family HTH domain
MKTLDTKDKYIELRAEGLSQRTCAKRLGVSAASVSRWEAEMAESISEARKRRLEEVYERYGMMKEARLRRLGGTIERLDKAAAAIDYQAIPAERILDLQIKFQEAFRDEYVSTGGGGKGLSPEGDLAAAYKALSDILRRLQEGAITDTQARGELAICEALIKTKETMELEKKLASLEEAISKKRDN